MNPGTPSTETEPIEISYAYDEKELLRARQWHWKSYGWMQYAWPVYGVILLVAGVGIYDGNPALAVACLVLGPYFMLRKRILQYRFLRNLRSTPLFGKTLRWKISAQGVVQEVGSSRADSSWDSFYQALITPEGFLLMPQKNLFYWLPLDGLADPTRAGELRDLVVQKIKHKDVR